MKIKALRFTHKQNHFYLCTVEAKLLVDMSYVARRGIDEEQGAVQRILNKSRISGVRDFILNDGFFPNNIILNVIPDGGLSFDEIAGELTIIGQNRIAQVIDGQHRVEGIKEAIKIDAKVGKMLLPTVFTDNLDTATCAEIFVSINTEQKPVPRTLIYDLYGMLNVTNKDFSIERGADIAKLLNYDESSPYQGYIKFPGTRKFKGGIQLSTIVNSLKSLVKVDGEFNKYSLTTLDYQATILKNYFKAIASYYGDDWDSTSNPFLFGSGFGAAIDIFSTRILPHCYSVKKFTENYFKELIVIPRDNLPKQSEVKGLSGEAALFKLKTRLIDFVRVEMANEDEFEI